MLTTLFSILKFQRYFEKLSLCTMSVSRKKRFFRILFSFIGFILIHFNSFNQTVTWTGSFDNDWHKACNWSPIGVPSCLNDVVIPTAKTPEVSGIAHCRTIDIQGTSIIDITGSGALEVRNVNTCSGTATDNTGGVTPTATAATAVANTSFTANWNSVVGATTYYLDVSTVSTFASFVTGYNNKNVGLVTSSAVTGLNCTTTYYYRLRASNSCGTSANSNTITTTTTGTPPPTPTATAATGISNGSYTANWNIVAGATGYQIQVSNSSTFGTIYEFSTIPGGGTSSYSSCVPCGGTWYYRIRALNPCPGAWSNTISFYSGACFACDWPNRICEWDGCLNITMCVCSTCECY